MKKCVILFIILILTMAFAVLLDVEGSNIPGNPTNPMDKAEDLHANNQYVAE